MSTTTKNSNTTEEIECDPVFIQKMTEAIRTARIEKGNKPGSKKNPFPNLSPAEMDGIEQRVKLEVTSLPRPEPQPVKTAPPKPRPPQIVIPPRMINPQSQPQLRPEPQTMPELKTEPQTQPKPEPQIMPELKTEPKPAEPVQLVLNAMEVKLLRAAQRLESRGQIVTQTATCKEAGYSGQGSYLVRAIHNLKNLGLWTWEWQTGHEKNKTTETRSPEKSPVQTWGQGPNENSSIPSRETFVLEREIRAIQRIQAEIQSLEPRSQERVWAMLGRVPGGPI
jgi:hypothetical protein